MQVIPAVAELPCAAVIGVSVREGSWRNSGATQEARAYGGLRAHWWHGKTGIRIHAAADGRAMDREAFADHRSAWRGSGKRSDAVHGSGVDLHGRRL